MNEWTKKYLKPIVGKKIVKVDVSEDGFPQIFLNDGTTLEISRDEEGNGAGFIFGLPNPE
jgi:hypothetical protein